MKKGMMIAEVMLMAAIVRGGLLHVGILYIVLYLSYSEW
jgi:hypothetical protein